MLNDVWLKYKISKGDYLRALEHYADGKGSTKEGVSSNRDFQAALEENDIQKGWYYRSSTWFPAVENVKKIE